MAGQQLGKAISYTLSLVLGSRRRLVHRYLLALLIKQDEIGECATYINAQPVTAQYAPPMDAWTVGAFYQGVRLPLILTLVKDPCRRVTGGRFGPIVT